MPQLQVRRLGYALGAEVTGVDLRRPLDEPTFQAIHAAWLEHLVLCFPGQLISKDDLLAFAGRFGGELDDFKDSKTRDPEKPHIILLSSKPQPGKKWDGYKAGLHWHSDGSFKLRPSTGTFVLAKEIPEVGGDTIFANQYMAYDTLSPTMKRIVDGLYCLHTQDNLPAAHLQAPKDLIASYRRSYVPAVHPVAKVHPETNRKALFMGHRVRKFIGLTEEESAPLCDFLNNHAVRYEFMYRHRWRVDDLIMWDNRCLMHYAPLDYDPQTQPRFLWRCSLIGPETGRLYSPELEEEMVAEALRSNGRGAGARAIEHAAAGRG